MATKQEILEYIRMLAEKNIVSKDELEAAYDAGRGMQHDIVLKKKVGITEILYYIGGGIVFLGIAILVSQNWSSLGFISKLLATFVTGIAAYIVGVLFTRQARTEPVGAAFYLISALVLPIGLYVLFDNAGYDASSAGTQSFIAALLLGMYLGSYFLFRKNIFVLFTILYATWLYYGVGALLLGSGTYSFDVNFYGYLSLIASLAYLFLGYAFSKNARSSLSGFLYGFGIFGFLGSALALGGLGSDQNIFWVIVYPGFVFGALFLSVYLKSKAFLTWGTIYLMVYILKLTAEFFSSGLGWPLALVLAGLALIGVGSVSLKIKKKYLSS